MNDTKLNFPLQLAPPFHHGREIDFIWEREGSLLNILCIISGPCCRVTHVPQYPMSILVATFFAPHRTYRMSSCVSGSQRERDKMMDISSFSALVQLKHECSLTVWRRCMDKRKVRFSHQVSVAGKPFTWNNLQSPIFGLLPSLISARRV